MGIQGLLPQLKSIMVPIHIKELQGCSVAVDTYSWLHKGALSCSTELCKGLPTSKHIDYCMHRVNLLRHYGVRPILVFDGGPLPMKNEQENKRARARRENLSRAMEHESNGNASAAYECYQKAVDISPSIAHDLIQVLKQENVSYVVAPYEADAEMTFLAISKQVDAVITEDSDLIAFGCPRIIYKMDKFGQGVEFQFSRLQQNKEINLVGFTQQMILEMCILSGCDYLQSLPGMGLKRAHALMKKFKAYDKVIKHLRYNSVAVSPQYEESFKKAILTFQHQRVYDPIRENIVHLLEPMENLGEDLDFVGPAIPQHIARGIAKGDLDPFTQMPIQKEGTSTEKICNETYQLKNFKTEGQRKKVELPAQKNILTNYFCFASLEAKRKFKAPRATPVHLNSSTKISKPDIDVHTKVELCKMNNSSISACKSENLLIIPPTRLYVKNGASHESSDPLEPYPEEDEKEVADDFDTQHGIQQHSVYKPCAASHKDSALNRGDDKQISEYKNVVVRSPYFLHSSMKDIVKDNLKCMDEGASDKCKDIVFDQVHASASDVFEQKNSVVNRNGTLVSSYFEHKDMDGNIQNESFLSLEKDTPAPMHNFELDASVWKTTKNDKKARVTSSYFQKKLKDNYNQDIKHDNSVGKDGIAVDARESTSGDNSPGNKYLENTVRKRKVVDMDDQNGAANNCNTPASCSSDLEEENEAKEKKFGSNISHLRNYSNIAEKSMEKFVSVISSFRYTSSGSRASGLRAPLKDIKNTSMKSSLGNLDLSKFAYVPTKQKASSRNHRV